MVGNHGTKQGHTHSSDRVRQLVQELRGEIRGRTARWTLRAGSIRRSGKKQNIKLKPTDCSIKRTRGKLTTRWLNAEFSLAVTYENKVLSYHQEVCRTSFVRSSMICCRQRSLARCIGRSTSALLRFLDTPAPMTKGLLQVAMARTRAEFWGS